MHDVFEGIIGFSLEQLFIYCIKEKIASLKELQTLVECYNYGQMSKQNIPSKLMTEKKNLGQNASQAKCLILHLPFILYRFKDQLKPIWLAAIETMLKIIQILLSDEIEEPDLKILNEMIINHLQCYQAFFDLPLKPKHHFLLHYVSVIRAMGPVVKFWAMRMEAKHQYFKQLVNHTKQFVNIKKTLAYKHQEQLFGIATPFKDDVELGKNHFLLNAKVFRFIIRN